jgi:hypothetical protein
MHAPVNVESPNNISEWQMGFNSAFKGLSLVTYHNENYDMPTAICSTYRFKKIQKVFGNINKPNKSAGKAILY